MILFLKNINIAVRVGVFCIFAGITKCAKMSGGSGGVGQWAVGLKSDPLPSLSLPSLPESHPCLEPDTIELIPFCKMPLSF